MSTAEVHLPFIQRSLGEVDILPILVGQAPRDSVSRALETLWGGPETAIIVSSISVISTITPLAAPRTKRPRSRSNACSPRVATTTVPAAATQFTVCSIRHSGAICA
jgi:hypothetical protein